MHQSRAICQKLLRVAHPNDCRKWDWLQLAIKLWFIGIDYCFFKSFKSDWILSSSSEDILCSPLPNACKTNCVDDPPNSESIILSKRCFWVFSLFTAAW